MKVTIAKRTVAGNIITTNIEPVSAPSGSIVTKLHRWTAKVISGKDGSFLKISSFFVDDEEDVEVLLIMVLGGEIAGLIPENLRKIFRTNELGAIYEGH